MCVPVYSLLNQAERKRKAFLEGVSIYLFSKLSLTYGGNINCYKSVYHPLSTLPTEIGDT